MVGVGVMFLLANQFSRFFAESTARSKPEMDFLKSPPTFFQSSSRFPIFTTTGFINGGRELGNMEIDAAPDKMVPAPDKI